MKQQLPTIIFIFLILLIGLTLIFFYEPKPNAAPVQSELTGLQEKTLQVMLEMNKLITSLSLLIAGALGSILLQKYSVIKIQSLGQKTTIIFCLVFAVLPIYFAYELYFRLLEMLSNEHFRYDSQAIELPQRMQFLFLVLSIVMFGVFVLNATLAKSRGSEDEKSNS